MTSPAIALPDSWPAMSLAEATARLTAPGAKPSGDDVPTMPSSIPSLRNGKAPYRLDAGADQL